MDTKNIDKDSLASERSFFKKETVVQCVIFGYIQGNLEVLLIKEEKSKGLCRWGLPSTSIKSNESTDKAAQRLLHEFNISENIVLHQLETYSNANPSTQNSTSTISYYALINMENYRINHNCMTYYIRWSKMKDLPDLNHDHKLVLEFSLLQLNTLFLESPVGFNLLPEKFTTVELMNLCKGILGIEANTSNFFRKFLQKEKLLPMGEQ